MASESSNQQLATMLRRLLACAKRDSFPGFALIDEAEELLKRVGDETGSEPISGVNRALNCLEAVDNSPFGVYIKSGYSKLFWSALADAFHARRTEEVPSLTVDQEWERAKAAMTGESISGKTK